LGLRVLLSTYWAFPHIGGVWTYVKIMRSRLEEMGHQVDIMAQHPELDRFYVMNGSWSIDKKSLLKQAEKAVAHEYELRRVKLTPWMLWRETEKRAFERACRLMDLKQYDLIHTQDIISTYAMRKVKPEAVPLVATIHGCLAAEWVANREIQARSRLEQDYLELEEFFGAMSPDRLILPSRWLGGRLSAFGIAHPHTHFIPYGLDQQKFGSLLLQDAKESLAPREREKTIIACPARLVAIKGQATLLEAMSRLVQKRRDVLCWLIGDGVMRDDLERQVERLGLRDHVMLLGKRSDVPKLLAASDIVVLPSLQDNLPFSIMEAQSLGKPVVASRVGGIVEMIDEGRNGLLAVPGDAADLYEKLLWLTVDKALRERQAKEARLHALTFWNDRMMLDQTCQVYEEALEGRKAPAQRIGFADRLVQRQRRLARTSEAPAMPPFATLQGTIKESATGSGMAGANVHLLDLSGVVLRSGTSNDEGVFRFDNPQYGNYELSFGTAARGLHTRKIAVTAGTPMMIDITL